MLSLTPAQQQVIEAEESLFLLGPAGTGKTTALSQRLLHLLASGEPAYTMLILVAEPEHERAYLETLHRSQLGPYSELQITPYNVMAREMVALFWPLLARPAGFARAYQAPTFLSYDLAQLLLWRIVTPMLAEGAFADLRLRPQQIVSQILDTLNRAALNGLSLDEAIERQKITWVGEADHLRHLDYAATAARQFRRRCLENGLLDLSLLVEVFDTRLVKHEEFYRYFSERYRHLLVDNVEEQTPAGHNFIATLMDATVSTAIAYDAGGGYKRFLAADPAGANQFHDRCRQVIAFDPAASFTSTPAQADLGRLVENYLLNSKKPTPQAGQAIQQVITVRYRREMVSSLVPVLFSLLDRGVAAADIAIITPYLDGALRYNLAQALREARIPYYLLRRRSTPREEPRVRAWLTWLALAHPDWNLRPSTYDVAEALSLSIAGLDPVRAALLADRLYLADTTFLLPAADLPEKLAQRIGLEGVALYERLRQWLLAEGGRHTIDAFLHRLCDGLLARPPFQPEADLAGAAVCAWLVRSAGRVRQAAPAMGLGRGADVGEAFINGIYQGLVTADPPELGDPPDLDGVMISTIYGYLLAGKPVRYQVWLETATQGWWDIPRQPLSNAFVLAQSRNPERPWTMDEEFHIRNQLLSRIIRGLCARCRDGIILAHSDLDRRGQRQDGPLWRALQPVREKQVKL
jgi:hypothetical protein